MLRSRRTLAAAISVAIACSVASSAGGNSHGARRQTQSANVGPFTAFPTGGQAKLLLHAHVSGDGYNVIGIRAGAVLCLRFVRTEDPGEIDLTDGQARGGRYLPASCVSERTVRRLHRPAYVFVADQRLAGRGRLSYGLASDRITMIETVHRRSGSTTVRVHGNTFLALAPAADERVDPLRFAVAISSKGKRTRLPVALPGNTGEKRPPGEADTPGPDRAAVQPARAGIGWLDRHEPRGGPYAPRAAFLPDYTPVWSRLVSAAPESPVRFGLSYWQLDATIKRRPSAWYCVEMLSALVNGRSLSCSPPSALRQDTLSVRIDNAAADDQFPLVSGLVSDAIRSLEIWYADGTHEAVPLQDNVYLTPTVRSAYPFKLVGYDTKGRVVTVW